MKNNFVFLLGPNGVKIKGPCEVIAYHDDTVRVRTKSGKVIAWGVDCIKKVYKPR